MPRNLEVFTKCADPGVAKPHNKLGGFTGIFISAYYWNGALTITGGVLYALALIAAGPTVMWCVTAAAVILAAVEFKDWYYNERLLCIRDRDCAIGTVISKPTTAEDGDRKLNLMLAPYTQAEIELLLIDHLDRNRAMLNDNNNFTAPFHTGGAPAMPSRNQMLSNRPLFQDYINDLKGSNPNNGDATSNMYNQIMIGLVDTLMQDPNKNFFNRFYRKDNTEITDAATWDAIPCDFDDTVNWQGLDAQSTITCVNPYTNKSGAEPLNAMFRFGSPNSEPMVPYLHCEVEGNAIAILMDDIITAATAFVVVCAVLGPLAGAAAAFLAWLFKKIVDWITGNDGDASKPDVDWDDPNFTGYGDITETSGDVVVLYGNWIMDTEHLQYFEIHPVRAYYIVAHNALGDGTPTLVDSNEDQIVVGDNFDPTQLTTEQVQEICRIISVAEEREPDQDFPVTEKQALSYGMMVRY